MGSGVKKLQIGRGDEVVAQNVELSVMVNMAVREMSIWLSSYLCKLKR